MLTIRTARGVSVRESQECRHLGLALLGVIGLAGCTRESEPPVSAQADPIELRIPDVPARAPVETARLNSNVFDSICRIGNPFAVVGWDLDPLTRFLYFVGPFNGADDGMSRPYLYFAIPGLDRARITTTLYLDRLEEAELRKHAKLDELRRFQLPHIVALPADAAEIERQLGKPTHKLELKSGLTRLVFERDVCLGEKRLVGVYVDVDDDRLVAAKGIDHPERLKWIASAGRPPPADDSPTYYLDWHPRDRSAQAAALAFVHRIEGHDLAGAREQLLQPDVLAQAVEEFAALFGTGATIDSGTLTYQTTRYELDLAEVAVVFALTGGSSIKATIELRESGKERWLVSDLRAAAKP